MAKIIVNDGSEESEFALTEQGATIGRVAKQCDIVIKVPEASRQHCRVKFEGGSWFVEDLGSSNGTRVNGRKVTTFELQDGDEIMVGKARLRFLESDVVDDEISLESEPEVELEISLEEDAWLRFLNTDRLGDRIVFHGRTTIGRRSSNTVSLTEKGVSGTHTEFVSEGGAWIVRDLGSTNGTIVNGEPLMEAQLSPGDRVRIGCVEFVFGIGENEGDGELAATVVMEEVPLEEEIFAISEANMRRRQKAATLFWLVFVVAVAGGGGWWIMQDTHTRSSRVSVPHIANNQLGQYGQFEPLEEDVDYLTTDSDAIDYLETTKRKASGAQALEVSCRDGEGDHYLAFSKTIDAVSTADRLEIGCRIRTSGLSGGSAGLSILWYDSHGHVLGASHLNAPPGESSFATIKGLFVPPYGAEKAAVAMGFHDATGRIIVDEVFALRSRGGGRVAGAHGYEFHLDASGALMVSRDGREILDHGGLYRRRSGNPEFQGRLVVSREYSGDESGVTLQGELQSDTPAAVQFEARAQGNGISWQGRVDAASDLWLGFHVDPDEGLVTVTEDGALRHSEDFRRSGVRELVVATGPRALRMVFEEPQSVEMQVGRRGAHVFVPLTSGAFKVQIQVDFSAERDQVHQLDQKARQADFSRGQYGEAMACYTEIVNRFAFSRETAERASQRLAELRRKARVALDRLNQEVDRVLFFQTFEDDRERLSQELSDLASSYAKSAFEKEFIGVRARLEGAWASIQSKRRQELAQNHLMRGLDLMEPEAAAPVLARGFFLSVLRLSPEGELADRARQELEKIKSLLGSE